VNFQAARETLEQTLDAEGFNRDAFGPAFTLLDNLQRYADPNLPLPDWRAQLPQTSSWWFLVDRYFGRDPLLTTGFVTANQPVATHAQSVELRHDLAVPGVPMILSGWTYTLADLQPWSHHQLLIISALMAIFDVSLLAILYRNLRLWLIQVVTLAFGIGAMIASMKLMNVHLNLLNVLSFRLVLAIGAGTRARHCRRAKAGNTRGPHCGERFRFTCNCQKSSAYQSWYRLRDWHFLESRCHDLFRSSSNGSDATAKRSAPDDDCGCGCKERAFRKVTILLLFAQGLQALFVR